MDFWLDCNEFAKFVPVFTNSELESILELIGGITGRCCTELFDERGLDSQGDLDDSTDSLPKKGAVIILVVVIFAPL